MNTGTQVIINASAHEIPLPDGMFHTVVTSPPYYSLRSYQGEQQIAWDSVGYRPYPGAPEIEIPIQIAALGLENTLEAYIGHLVMVFREVWRVLRDDGTCWIVIGDSYNAAGYSNHANTGGLKRASGGKQRHARISHLQPGDLMGIPHRLMFALQGDGWIVRNDVVWQKKSPMPESLSGWRWERHKVRVPKDEIMSRLSAAKASGNVQPQSTEQGRATNLLQGVYGAAGESVQADTRGQGKDKSCQAGLSADRQSQETSARVFESSRCEGREAQAKTENRQTVSALSKGKGHTNSGQGEATNKEKGHAVNPNGQGLAENPRGPQPSMPLLRQEKEAGIGSCDTNQHGRDTHGGKCGPSLSNMQCGERQQAVETVLIDCPGCSKCSATGGYVLRRGSWRHTRAHETVLMCVKSMGYYADQERVREENDPANVRHHDRYSERLVIGKERNPDRNDGGGTRQGGVGYHAAGRNPRSVLTPSPESYSGSHYAVFPRTLISPLLQATAPTRVCPLCGAPWAPVVEVTTGGPQRKTAKIDGHGSHGPGYYGSAGQAWQDWKDANPNQVQGHRPTCECGYPGLEPGDLESVGSPTGSRIADDPSLETGRAGYNRQRGPNEGQRFITRYEQRKYAGQIKASPHRPEMEADVDSDTTFAHYIRTDGSGARPVPQELLDRWIDNGWIEKVTIPSGQSPDPVPGWALDPFVGSGTMLEVCRELGVNAVGLDISAVYLDDHAKPRIGQTPSGALETLPLFAGLEDNNSV